MSLNQIPAVFVALFLTPNQFDLFDEVKAEAVDVLEEWSGIRPELTSTSDDTFFLDWDSIRVGLSWTTLPAGDVLTLAIGTLPSRRLTHEQAEEIGDKLRKITSCAEALFEVNRSLWQITSMPLTLGCIRNHKESLLELDLSSGSAARLSFFAFEPNELEYLGERGSNISENMPVEAEIATSEEIDESGWALQMSALALSTAFVLVTPPVGVAMFTYAALRQTTNMDLLPRSLGSPNPGTTVSQRRSITNNRGQQISMVVD